MATSSNSRCLATSADKHGYSAESRSTSAGSRESRHCDTGLPEYEYPVPVIIRNTFLDTREGRSVSLEEFFEERRIHSCPVAPPEQDPESGLEVPDQSLGEVMFAGAQAFATQVGTAAGFWTATPTASEYDMSFQPGSATDALQEAPRLLMLSEALPEPEVGSQQCPTLGSVGHYEGTCKPCAFLYTKGCENGAQCTFCHLCPPDEKRRRQKEKQQAFREMRRQKNLIQL